MLPKDLIPVRAVKLDYYKCGEYKYKCEHKDDKWNDYFSCGEYKYQLADPIQSKYVLDVGDQPFTYFSKFDYNKSFFLRPGVAFPPSPTFHGFFS